MGSERRGLLVDNGGVLTTDLFDSFSSFCTQEGIEPDAVGRRSPTECVFVDDLLFNLTAAEDLGMATIHRVEAERTIAELEQLLGISLR